MNKVRLRAITRAGSIAAIGVSICLTKAFAQSTASMPVPFVGCAADGQMGPVAAPSGSRSTRSVSGAAASKLAYYASTDLAVLGPRGWHCFGLYGSNGSTLIVTPEPHDARDFLLRLETKLTGPVIELSRTLGGTSGRFRVAMVGARIFPVSRPFVQQVIDEKILPKSEFPTGPYPADALVRRGDTEVEYLTPANRDGLGTNGWVSKNGQTISGVAILLPEDDMDLVMLAVRLPLEIQALAPTILQAVEENHGTPPADVHR